MKLNIIKSDIMNFDINHLKELSIKEDDWQIAGRSEFRLYAYLSTFFNDIVILDIGSRYGGSALALSHNPNNKVISYDLVEQGASAIQKENITWKIKNFMEDDELDWNKIKLINIDVDPHDGIQERVMMDWLRKKEWKGILLHDDIGPEWPLTEAMWNEIPEEKFDLTDMAHYCGTGLVNFGNAYDVSIIR